jgi:hypothetical protein
MLLKIGYKFAKYVSIKIVYKIIRS